MLYSFLPSAVLVQPVVASSCEANQFDVMFCACCAAETDQVEGEVLASDSLMDEHVQGDSGQTARPAEFTAILDRTDGMRLGIGVTANQRTKVLEDFVLGRW